MLALAAGAAYSQQLTDLEESRNLNDEDLSDLEDLDELDDDEPHERLLESLGARNCMSTATGP